jgi:hypothetical protein
MALNRERPAPAAFADEVLALLRWARNGHVGQPPSHSVYSAKAAVGLSAIDQLIRRETDVLKQGNLTDLENLADKGLLDASDMLEALMTGRDHPIFNFVQGIRASGKRPQSAPPTIRELHGRAALVGLVRAYCTAAGASELEALRVVAECCSLENFKFTSERIKGWGRRFKDEQNDGPAAFANDFLKKAAQRPDATPLADRVLEVGRLWARAYWMTPVPRPA